VTASPLKIDPAEPSAEELARRAQGGDVTAFETLVGWFGPRLLRYLRQRTRNLHTAEDLLQETFLKAFRGLSGYDSSRSLTTWLFTIATRVSISHGRRRTEIVMSFPGELSGATTGSPDEIVAMREEGRNLWARAQRVLPEPQFMALWLRYAEEMSIGEMAGVMGTSASNTKVLLHRARRRLADSAGAAEKNRSGGRSERRADNEPYTAGSNEVKYVREPGQSGAV